MFTGSSTNGAIHVTFMSIEAAVKIVFTMRPGKACHAQTQAAPSAARRYEKKPDNKKIHSGKLYRDERAPIDIYLCLPGLTTMWSIIFFSSTMPIGLSKYSTFINRNARRKHFIRLIKNSYLKLIKTFNFF